MTELANITNAGLLLLIIGWTFIGSSLTFVAMQHYNDRREYDAYRRGYTHAERARSYYAHPSNQR